MTMTPDDKFNQQVWEILQKIKEESLATGENKPVSYRFGHFQGAGIIPKKRKKDILFKLQEWGALKVRDDPFVPPIPADDEIYLDILQPKFDEVYKTYEKLNSPTNEIVVVKPQNSLINTSVLTANLERRYQSFINLPDKGFFIGIADYVDYLVNNSGFESIIQSIVLMQTKDGQRVEEFENKVIHDLEEVSTALFDAVDKQKIQLENLDKFIDEYKAHGDGRIQSTAQPAEAQYSQLTRIIDALYQAGFGKLVKHLVEVDDPGKYIKDYKISEFYTSYQLELQNFRNRMKISLWGSWGNLNLVYLVIHCYEDEMERMSDRKYFWQRQNFYGLHKEMQQILGTEKGDSGRVHFIRDEYIIHLNRVHNYFMDFLSNPADDSQPPVDLADTSSRRAYEKKWDVLQAIWDIYESHSRPDSIFVPVARLTIKDRGVELIDGIVEGFKKEGFFKNWERKDRWYSLEFINHVKLPEIYEEVGKAYKRSAAAYQEQNGINKTAEIQTSGNIPYCTVEKGIGYLKFGKHGTKKKVGRANSRPFRFLQVIIEPIGVFKSVDAVFTAIWVEKDNQDSKLTNPSTAKSRKVEIIKNSAIKELQKNNKLSGKIKFEFNQSETQLKAISVE